MIHFLKGDSFPSKYDPFTQSYDSFPIRYDPLTLRYDQFPLRYDPFPNFVPNPSRYLSITRCQRPPKRPMECHRSWILLPLSIKRFQISWKSWSDEQSDCFNLCLFGFVLFCVCDCQLLLSTTDKSRQLDITYGRKMCPQNMSRNGDHCLC